LFNSIIGHDNRVSAILLTLELDLSVDPTKSTLSNPIEEYSLFFFFDLDVLKHSFL